jgi:hypothetical protein
MNPNNGSSMKRPKNALDDKEKTWRRGWDSNPRIRYRIA